METLYKTFYNEQLEDGIRTYSAFGYDVMTKEKVNWEKTKVHFIRVEHLPQKKRLNELRRKYRWLNYRNHYHGYMWIVLALAIGVLNLVFNTQISAGIMKALLFIKMPDNQMTHMVASYMLYGVAALCILFALLALIPFSSRRMNYLYRKNEIVTEGLEIQLKIRILPKDEFVRKDGTHYHKIYDYFKNKNGLRR